MRPTALLTALCALTVSGGAVGINVSSELAALTRSHAGLLSSLENANPTSLLNSADAALKTLSDYAATATGALGSSLRAEETVLASIISNAHQSLSHYAGMTATSSPGVQPTGYSGASASSSAAAPSQVSAGFAAATGVPVLAAGALAALALL